MTFRAYVENIKAKSGKTPDDFWKLANKKGFVKRGKIAAKHPEIVNWLKHDARLGHVHASFIAVYLRLRAKDPTVGAKMKRWAYNTGYREYVK